MKIVFVLGELSMGGAERQLLLLARGLVAAGHDVTLALFRGKGALRDEAEAANIRIGIIGGATPLATMMCLRRLIRAERPDVVHGYLTAGNIASLVARSLPSRPVIAWGIRASNMQMRNYGVKWRIAASLERALSGMADLLIANSQAGKRELVKRGLEENRIAVIENGIDLDRVAAGKDAREEVRVAWGVEFGKRVIGHVGRIDPMKDHATFLSSLVHLHRIRQDWNAVVVAVGSEDDRERLRRETAEKGLSAEVRIVSATNAMAGVYAGFDLFCSSSSYGEGFSNVIAEALGAGLPVVATDVGDARLLVGEAGVIVAPRDPQALAEALDIGLEKRSVMGAKARSRIANFSIDRLAAQACLAFEVACAGRR